jgi:hypothetical protein
MPTAARLPGLAGALAATRLVLPALPLRAADGDLDPTFDGGAFTLAWSAQDAWGRALEPIADRGHGVLVSRGALRGRSRSSGTDLVLLAV